MLIRFSIFSTASLRPTIIKMKARRTFPTHVRACHFFSSEKPKTCFYFFIYAQILLFFSLLSASRSSDLEFMMIRQSGFSSHFDGHSTTIIISFIQILWSSQAQQVSDDQGIHTDCLLSCTDLCSIRIITDLRHF